MALFIGRLANVPDKAKIEELMRTKGPLKRWDPRPAMCFVTFENEKDAEAAMEAYQDYEIIPGHKLSLEWTKESGRTHENRPRVGTGVNEAQGKPPVCYKCGEPGHVTRTCPRNAAPGPSSSSSYRSRSPPRDSYRRSPPRDYRDRDYRDRDYRPRSRSRERDYYRDRPRRDSRDREYYRRERSRSPPPRSYDRERDRDYRERPRSRSPEYRRRSRSRTPPRAAAARDLPPRDPSPERR